MQQYELEEGLEGKVTITAIVIQPYTWTNRMWVECVSFRWKAGYDKEGQFEDH